MIDPEIGFTFRGIEVQARLVHPLDHSGNPMYDLLPVWEIEVNGQRFRGPLMLEGGFREEEAVAQLTGYLEQHPEELGRSGISLE